MSRLNNFVVQRVFPLLVWYATNPSHILIILCLWVSLLFLGAFTGVELVVGNYFNGLSGAVSCAVLYQQIHTQKAVKDLHAKVDAHIQNQEAHNASVHQKLDALSKKPKKS